MKTRIALELSTQLHADIQKISKENETTLSTQVRQILKNYVETYKDSHPDAFPQSKPNDDDVMTDCGYTKGQLRELYAKPAPNHQVRAYEEAKQITTEPAPKKQSKPIDMDKLISDWEDS